MNPDEMFMVLEDEYLMRYVESHNVISTGYFTVFTLATTDSSVLKYLNNNGFPVVYSDTDGFIVVKF